MWQKLWNATLLIKFYRYPNVNFRTTPLNKRKWLTGLSLYSCQTCDHRHEHCCTCVIHLQMCHHTLSHPAVVHTFHQHCPQVQHTYGSRAATLWRDFSYSSAHEITSNVKHITNSQYSQNFKGNIGLLQNRHMSHTRCITNQHQYPVVSTSVLLLLLFFVLLLLYTTKISLL